MDILFVMKMRLTDFFHFAGTYAARAHMHPYMGAVRSHCLDALDVRLGHFLGFVVGMAYLVSAELALAANFACTCHRYDPPQMK
jgi:hypothetical protein